jgi:hypothetical protein
MEALCDSKVCRGGASQQTLYYETGNINVSAERSLEIDFIIGSGGRGRTQVRLIIGPRDFENLIGSMARSHRQVAMEAMANELQRQISEQPDFDKQVARAAQARLLTRAHDRYLAAEGDSEDWRYAVCSEVEILIEEEEND